ncbi:uncharacterized protein LAESUDRAFT_734266 [Laetiporus sulphureus 93-53]|uniref:GID complex catalytic subunit 2 n=1 Tax=Laetiporus sulphureus 93-53 TaxID=1314785 RepID=A0A165H8R4_9APHY|nr:uncharacterized protein LAESUDRAFT_734266 [Laetiporus sulphureus 93-53]KZT11400.1 hypothetical protein LAESUDRAFT_734266 [Laetiporus sulphureus 93-53]
MDGPLKELTKLEELTSNASAKGKTPSVNDSLDSLLQSLREVQDRLKAGTVTDETLTILAKTVETKKMEVDERQKEAYNSLMKVGKTLDKKFSTALPSYPPMFTSPEANAALEHSIALHFLRTGQFHTAQTFIEESGVEIDSEKQANFAELYRIMTALKYQNVGPALEWAARNRHFLHHHSSSLEFLLHRSQFMRLILTSHPPDYSPALTYARTVFPPFYSQHEPEIRRLMTCMLYLPLARLQLSPYADLASPSLHSDLEPMFAKEYCASLGMSKQVPLRVVGDIGGGGALARIEKGRKVMRERKSEWSRTDELPIEISLPPENRYHSIFACPVSKEQSTEQNPPMMMSCGHVIAKDSLQKLSKPGGCIPEFAGLTPEDVEFIDTVINRAPATATTFLTVFKAYNDVLQERGLDPQEEVAYYGKLLKLGTLKGRNWGEKWNTIKHQQGYATRAGNDKGQIPRATQNTPAPSKVVTTRLTTGLRKAPPEDTLTLHSYPDPSDAETTDWESVSQVGPRHHDTPRPVRRTISPTLTTTTNSLGLHTGPPSAHVLKDGSRMRGSSNHVFSHWNDETSEGPRPTTATTSTIPPSYGAAIRDNAPARYFPRTATRGAVMYAPSMPSSSSTAVRSVLPRDNDRKANSIDEDEAWNKVMEVQDCKEADRFREDKLIERCWDIWRQGYEWIITTHDQIVHARDTVVLRRAYKRWRGHLADRQDLCRRVASISDKRRMQTALELWKVKLKEKQQADWRNAMRTKMRMVRERREASLLKEAWTKWRKAHQLQVAEQYHSRRLAVRFFSIWKTQLAQLDELDAAAEHLLYDRQERSQERYFDLWRREMVLRRTEREMTERVNLRIMGQALDVWKQHLNESQTADTFHDLIIKKRALAAWKRAKARVQSLESKALKHLARQDDLLIRAVMRVWKAHERGRLLERVSNSRVLKQVWVTWKERLRRQRDLEGLALAFSMRAHSTLASSSLQKWRQAYSAHQNAQEFAAEYFSRQLLVKTNLTWRLHLRARFKLAKQARIVSKLIIQRKYWKKWVEHLAQRRLQKRLKEFENGMARRYFEVWLETAKKKRQLKMAEEIMRQRIQMRLMAGALSRWINRVVDIKDRELQVNQRVRKKMLIIACKKWKTVCIRHVEELSLMESYQDVKREEMMRRMFYRWLTAARKVRHRRLHLQQREEELKLTADDFLLQKQKNIMFRAFGIWHAKTRSLPAVRLHAYHTKIKAWSVWRDAMPRALQAKAARQMDRTSVLAQAFEKWQKAYKTKIELKAVA